MEIAKVKQPRLRLSHIIIPLFYAKHKNSSEKYFQ